MHVCVCETKHFHLKFKRFRTCVHHQNKNIWNEVSHKNTDLYIIILSDINLWKSVNKKAKYVKWGNIKSILILYCFNIKSCAILFKNLRVSVCGGGGGGSMLHNTLHKQIYRVIRLFMFYGRILNLVVCARYVCVRVCTYGYVCVPVDQIISVLPMGTRNCVLTNTTIQRKTLNLLSIQSKTRAVYLHGRLCVKLQNIKWRVELWKHFS